MIILKKDILNNIFFCYTYFNKRRLIMKKSVVSEIYLTSKSVSKESWHDLFLQLTDYLGSFSTFQIFVVCELNKIHYYIRTGEVIPTILGEMSDFMFREVDVNWSFVYEKGFVYMNHLSDTVVDIFDRESLKKNREVSILELDFRSISGQRLLSKGYLYIKEAGIVIRRKLFKTIPEILLSIDFSKNKKYVCQSQPKYLDFQKSLSLFHSDSLQALLSVSMFPYFSKDYYLNLSSYSFDKHSFIVGASGSGKSKFISLFIRRLAASLDYKLKYKVVVIDPHASLEEDIGGIPNTFIGDFLSVERSVNLFLSSTDNVVVAGELLLSLFSSYMKNLYNSKLERVLRHSLLLLLYQKQFTFKNLRKVLLEVEYREKLLKEELPDSVLEFFFTDFTELKNKYYNEAIAPIISFLDEMELIPVFQQDTDAFSLQEVIQKNFLTLFSLNRTILGESSVRTISGLIMQQLMTLIQERKIDEHIILIVDEVSAIENPILLKFLSEARKFGLSLILAQQYFEQISKELQDAIFANVVNYYVFRVSRKDAITLSSNISMKLAREDSEENRISMLVNLGDRECVVRLGNCGVMLPAFKGKTVDFVPIKKKKETKIVKPVPKSKVTITPPKKKFEITPSIKMTEILLEQSSSRRNMRGDNNE